MLGTAALCALALGGQAQYGEEEEHFVEFSDQGNRTKFLNSLTAFEFPHPPVYGTGNQNIENKRKDKQNLPLFLPSLTMLSA